MGVGWFRHETERSQLDLHQDTGSISSEDSEADRLGWRQWQLKLASQAAMVTVAFRARAILGRDQGRRQELHETQLGLSSLLC